ncbi:hypothetical protein [Psychrobacter sp. JCM 18901]|uniref:hypothetical protein n=1 Tax=Psychrobacter sp. JCM 18901 TaxID=1298609 RepID=UPI0021C40CAC|nr:hypothetical protein [Psychrobacter sp. JCM 18901]
MADHVITRSVRDSAAMLDATSGAEIGAPYVIAPPDGTFFASGNACTAKAKNCFASAAFDSQYDSGQRGVGGTCANG